MPEQKTAGQVAYEAYYLAMGMDAGDWPSIGQKRQDWWEQVARAVYAFYETGLPGAH
jgi:hypothetical protein